jgi:N-methylhydantoinase A
MTICGAARRAGLRQVLVPRTAAVFSAFGIGFSDVSQHYEQPLQRTDAEAVAEPGDVAQHVQVDELASLELSLTAPLPHVSVGVAGEVSATAAVAAGTRTVQTRGGAGKELPVYTLLDQPRGAEAEGPAVIRPPDWRVRAPRRSRKSPWPRTPPADLTPGWPVGHPASCRPRGGRAREVAALS